MLLAAPCVWYPRRGSCPAVPSHSALCSSGDHPVPAFPACLGHRGLSRDTRGFPECPAPSCRAAAPQRQALLPGSVPVWGCACPGHAAASRACRWHWEQLLQPGAAAAAPPAVGNRSSHLCREVPAVWESPAGVWPRQGGGTELQTDLRAKAAGAEPKGRTCWQDLVWCSMRGSSPQSENLNSQGANASTPMGDGASRTIVLAGVGRFICGSRGGFLFWEQLQSAVRALLHQSLSHPSLSAGEEKNGSAAVCRHRHCQQHSWKGGRVRQVPLLCFA